jgi:predicted RNA-binding Zn ribbon-like protein
MIFAHDTEVSLEEVAALINTARDAESRPVERLPDAATLLAFVKAQGWTGRLDGNTAELNAVRKLRPRLARFWEVGEAAAVDLVNEMLREGGALPQLVKHDRWDYHVHATSPDAPLADRMAVDAAMAMIDVIRMKELDRLRVCEGEQCNRVLVDLSKNRSRRFCDAGCGNRANVAAYRSRLKKAHAKG